VKKALKSIKRQRRRIRRCMTVICRRNLCGVISSAMWQWLIYCESGYRRNYCLLWPISIFSRRKLRNRKC
jgi:hypothetical protein